MTLTDTLPRTAEAMRGAVAALEAKLGELRARRARTLAEDPRLRAEMEETRDRLEVARDRLGIVTAQEAAERQRKAEADAEAAAERRRAARDDLLAEVDAATGEWVAACRAIEAAAARFADLSRKLSEHQTGAATVLLPMRGAHRFVPGMAQQAGEMLREHLPAHVPVPTSLPHRPRRDPEAWRREMRGFLASLIEA